MGVSLKEAVGVGSYLVKHRLIKRTKRFPLVLMLEPLLQCNVECLGCGKIQFPQEILKKRLSAEECWHAIEECGAPIVSIAGGEPLIHQEIDRIVEGYVERKKFIYLCTNGILLKKKMSMFKPSDYLTFSVHLDGLEETHDKVMQRPGAFQTALDGIKALKEAGFRVMTNTTFFEGHSVEEARELCDLLTSLKVDGMMISPGYAYKKAPDQEHFLKRERVKAFFRAMLDGSRKKGWKFNHSPLFLEFLQGKHQHYNCTAWGNPTRNVFGWQKPCYLLGDGFVSSYKELMETTDWDKYGRGKDERCADCMVHSGWEATAVNDMVAHPLRALRAAMSV